MNPFFRSILVVAGVFLTSGFSYGGEPLFPSKDIPNSNKPEDYVNWATELLASGIKNETILLANNRKTATNNTRLVSEIAPGISCFRHKEAFDFKIVGNQVEASCLAGRERELTHKANLKMTVSYFPKDCQSKENIFNSYFKQRASRESAELFLREFPQRCQLVVTHADPFRAFFDPATLNSQAAQSILQSKPELREHIATYEIPKNGLGLGSGIRDPLQNFFSDGSFTSEAL